MPAPRHENSGLSFENRASKHQNQNIRFLPLKRFCKTVSVRKADLVEREIFVRRFPNLPCLLPLLLKQNLLITGKAPPLFSWFLTISSWRWPWCAYCIPEGCGRGNFSRWSLWHTGNTGLGPDRDHHDYHDYHDGEFWLSVQYVMIMKIRFWVHDFDDVQDFKS